MFTLRLSEPKYKNDKAVEVPAAGEDDDDDEDSGSVGTPLFMLDIALGWTKPVSLPPKLLLSSA